MIMIMMIMTTYGDDDDNNDVSAAAAWATTGFRTASGRPRRARAARVDDAAAPPQQTHICEWRRQPQGRRGLRLRVDKYKTKYAKSVQSIFKDAQTYKIMICAKANWP